MNPLNPEDIDDLKQLIEFLKENQIAEFELDRGDMKVRRSVLRDVSQPTKGPTCCCTTASACCACCCGAGGDRCASHRSE